MIDGSQKDFEENLIWTKKMAALAHEKGVLVEAELGKLAGEEVRVGSYFQNN
jgi:fructose-bisphosphate aldolase class II